MGALLNRVIGEMQEVEVEASAAKGLVWAPRAGAPHLCMANPGTPCRSTTRGVEPGKPATPASISRSPYSHAIETQWPEVWVWTPGGSARTMLKVSLQ